MYNRQEVFSPVPALVVVDDVDNLENYSLVR